MSRLTQKIAHAKQFLRARTGYGWHPRYVVHAYTKQQLNDALNVAHNRTLILLHTAIIEMHAGEIMGPRANCDRVCVFGAPTHWVTLPSMVLGGAGCMWRVTGVPQPVWRRTRRVIG